MEINTVLEMKLLIKTNNSEENFEYSQQLENTELV
jgi:hypothetical protein